MTSRNDDTSQSIDLGSTFLTLTSGAVLTPSAGSITPTASHHHVAAGTISTIATTSIDTNGEALLLLTADGNVVITTGATIVGHTTYLTTNDEILYVLDGGTKWREVAVNHTVPVSGGGTGITSITDGDLLRGVNGSPENTLQAIPNPSSTTRLFLSTKTTLGAIGFTYVQPTPSDIDSSAVPRCRAYQAVGQSIPNSAVTALTFDTEEYDVSTMHSTSSNTSRFTVPAGQGGLYLIMGAVDIPASAAGSLRTIFTRKNGSTLLSSRNGNFSAGAITRTGTESLTVLAAADYVEICVYQDTGGAVTTNAASPYQTWGAVVRLL